MQVATSLTLYETNGEFVPNEPLIFNGIENSRVSVVTSFGDKRCKINFCWPTFKISGNVGSAKSFVAVMLN